MGRKLEIEIVGDASSLRRALGVADKQTSSFGSTVGKLGKTAALSAGVAGVGALIYTLKTGISEFSQSQKVAAQTNAVIKSTGQVANVSAKHVDELGTSIMKKSGFDDEAVKSGENLLLTFTNIHNEVGKGNKIFDRATQVTADLAVAFHKDLGQSAILVGKALNDPIKGLTALQRVGIQFSAGQKEVIKHLVETGHTAEAQKLILNELNKQVGGSAAAYGKTLPGMIDIARQSFNNWAGDLIAKMIPTLTNLGNWIRTNWPQISGTIKNAWEQDIQPPLAAMTELLTSIVGFFTDNWSTIGPIVEASAKIIQTNIAIITGVLKTLTALIHGDWSGAWKAFEATVKSAIAGVKARLELAGAIGGAIVKAAKAIGTAIVGAITGALEGIGGKAWNVINNIGSTITSNLSNVLSWGEKVGSHLISGIVSGLAGLPGKIVGLIKAAVNAVIDKINSALSFHVSVDTHIPGVGKKSFGYDSHIPHLASGGIVTGPTVAMIGERGPEAVVPLSRGGGKPMIVNLVLDGKVAAQALIDPLRSEARIVQQRTGRPAFS